ncbi:MAG: hypothetical protein GC164_14975 [Phycisphaera sp.]|nr:hypothetical protein [Phycisphaera sp.]
MKRPAVYFALFCTLALGAGCELMGYVANGIAPSKIKALYKLEDRPTLVLVDDPLGKLGNPALTGVIAARVGFDLTQAKTLTTVIDPQDLASYQLRRGRAYASTPVDVVGKDLGAQQVIHIWIENAGIDRPSPTLLQPYAVARVKVIDTLTGKRLFPVPQSAEQKDDKVGSPVVVRFDRPIASEDNAVGEVSMVAREIADRLGVGAAHLFYDHLPPEPGSSLKP